MPVLLPNKSEMEERVRALNLQVADNYLLAYHHMSNGKRVVANLMGGRANLITAHYEQAYLVVFTDKAITTQLLKDGTVASYPRSEISNFTVRDGAEQSLVFDFDAEGKHLSFYAYKDSGARMRYVAQNIEVLLSNHFLGLAPELPNVVTSGWRKYRYAMLESLLPLALMVVLIVSPGTSFKNRTGIIPAILILVMIWWPFRPKPHRS